LTFDLVGIGNPVYDTIVTPQARTKGRVLSGCSTNACLAAKRLGLTKVGLIGSIGRDFGPRFLRDMNTYGIDVRSDSANGETGGFHLVYDARGDRTLDVLGVADRITPANIPKEYLDAKFLLIGPILGEIDLTLVDFIRSSTSARLFLDPQGLVRIIGTDRRVLHKCDKVQFGKIAELVDIIKPNEHESQTITGEKDPVLAARQIRQLGPAITIVTLADRGSILIDDDSMRRIPAFPTTAIDPTGAGDVYAGSFITHYIGKGSAVEAAIFASAAASLKVEQMGPDFRIPLEVTEQRKNEIRERFLAANANQ
jgi:sugar/nucleoside kinase (ribokinase family)